MTTEPTNLNEQRALRADDNTLWTSEDCAAAFMRDLRSGEVKPSRMLILYEELNPSGDRTIAAYSANLARDQEILMLWLRLHAQTHRWALNTTDLKEN